MAFTLSGMGNHQRHMSLEMARSDMLLKDHTDYGVEESQRGQRRKQGD